MKTNTILTLIFALGLVTTSAANAGITKSFGGGAIGISDYIDYNAYNAKFRLPVDASNIKVQSLFATQIKLGRDEKWIPGCQETVDGAPNECVDYNVHAEKGLQAVLTFESYNENPPADVGSNDYNEITVNFHFADMTPEKVAAIPKVNFFGKGSKANRAFAAENLNVVVTDETVVEGRIDYDKSIFCPTDSEGNKLDYTCQDQIVTVPVNVQARFVEVTVKN